MLIIYIHCFFSFTQEPVACELGTSFRYQQMGTKRRLVEVTETFQYVPLLPNLEKLLNNKDIFQEVPIKEVLCNDHCVSFRLQNYMQEMITLLVTFVMLPFIRTIPCFLTVMDPSNFSSSCIMVMLR